MVIILQNCGQDAGAILLDFMGCNSLFQIFKMLLQYRPGMSIFVPVMLQGVLDAKEATEALKERDVESMLSESWESLHSVLDRCERMLRLMACVLALQLPESMDPALQW